ncbi:MAG TPA: PorV/PorQ family protein [Gemmatimonadales bacterium]|jgi:hypothetical protein
MNRFSVLKVATVGVLALVPAVASAQSQTNNDNTGYGTTSAEFLLLGANARGMALGGAYAAVATDVGGLNANPGAVALIKRPSIEGSQLNYVADTKLNWGAVALPFGGGSSVIGFQIGTFGFSDQPVYTASQPNGTGAFYSVNETFLAATISKNFSDRFSVGITAKGISDHLGDVDGSAFAVDFGTHFHSQLGGKAVRFAFSLTNLGTEMSYSGQALNQKVGRISTRDTLPDQGSVTTLDIPVGYLASSFGLPTTFRVALAYDVLSTKDAKLDIMGEFNQMRANRGAFGGGAEFTADHIAGTGFGVALRGSYSYNPSLSYSNTGFVNYNEPSEDKSAGLAYGGGIWVASKSGFQLGVDYARRKMGILGDVDFFTVTLGW